MNMIEKVAKVIWNDMCPGIRQTEQDKVVYEEVAKAAIETMRDMYFSNPNNFFREFTDVTLKEE